MSFFPKLTGTCQLIDQLPPQTPCCCEMGRGERRNAQFTQKYLFPPSGNLTRGLIIEFLFSNLALLPTHPLHLVKSLGCKSFPTTFWRHVFPCLDVGVEIEKTCEILKIALLKNWRKESCRHININSRLPQTHTHRHTFLIMSLFR